MKTLISVALIATIVSANTQPQVQKIDLRWVDSHIEAIIPKRVGISNSLINKVSNPMKIIVKKKKVESTKSKEKRSVAVKKTDPLLLKAIINSKALIGSKWVKVDDTVQGFKIKEITGSKVYLVSSKGKSKTLFLHKKTKSIQIKTK